MGASRAILLAAAQNQWLKERARRYGFVRKSVSRFMPGETLDAAVVAARELSGRGIRSAFTHLGENIADANEAEDVVRHYLEVLARIRAEGLQTEISVKPTQLGLDLSQDLCEKNLRRLVEAEDARRTVWIDMESSAYVDRTLEIYRQLLAGHSNCGVCLQAYLHRTAGDVEELMPLKPSVRLVKGAYREGGEIAAQKKMEIDANYLRLSQRLLEAQREDKLRRAILATHDGQLIEKIKDFASREKIERENVEVQMLYGIQKGLQERLARDGWRSSVLVAYGTHWYAWFLRRLAERPANVWLVVKNLAPGKD